MEPSRAEHIEPWWRTVSRKEVLTPRAEAAPIAGVLGWPVD